MVSDKRVEYAVAVLAHESATECSSWPLWLTYGANIPSDTQAKARLHIVQSPFFGDSYGKTESLPTLPLSEIDGVPLLFGEPVIERCGNVLVVKADIIASAYFLLTRYEEWVRSDVRDEHGRFPGRQSLPFRAGFIDRPIVDEYAALLRKWAKEIGIELPGLSRQFSVLLTHDVDVLRIRRSPWRPILSLGHALLGRQPWRKALHKAAIAGGLRADVSNNIADVIQMDRRLTLRYSSSRCQSIFFFMAGGKSNFDGNYRINEPLATAAIRQVIDAKAEIGLHASYQAGQQPGLIGQERKALEQASGAVVFRNRHHFLSWRTLGDGSAIASSGIRWDSTLGYCDVAGFRLGVCHSIPLFDPAHHCLLGIEEHPLVVMDCTLSDVTYMKLNEEDALDYVRRLANVTYHYRGEFVILWHPNVLRSVDLDYHRRLYPKVIDYLGQLLDNTPYSC